MTEQRVGLSVLVTGASGFVARSLVPLLASAGYAVTGAAKTEKPAYFGDNIRWQTLDLTDPASLGVLSRDWWAVIHMAGNTIPQTYKSSNDVLANLGITLNLLEYLRSGRFLLVSSCHVYSPSTLPLTEQSLASPVGQYGLSKVMCEQAALAYLRSLDVRVARPFNHLGIGMDPRLMVPSLIQRVLAERGSRQPLRMLGRDSVRDFIDVRDVVSAYQSIIELDQPVSRVFNVCTGQQATIGDVARTILQLAGERRDVVFEQIALSSDDTATIVGDGELLQTTSNWKPKYSLRDSLRDILGQYAQGAEGSIGVEPLSAH